MLNILNKIFSSTKNLNVINQKFLKLRKETSVEKIFSAIEGFSEEAEIRYVGGCVRKIIKDEKVDDIDLATNIEPSKVKQALENKKINYFETGIKHGTITAVIDNNKFEITSLRSDIKTDGRHAEIEFTNNWVKDAERRDFTINSIYADINGNLFDPFNGKKDLENGILKFVGDPEQRIKEDYLRILRYLRFFLNYSKQPHNLEIIKSLKINIGGILKLSKERLLDELKKIAKIDNLEKLNKDKLSLDLILMIFPELKNIKVFSKLSSSVKELLKKKDFIFLISLMIIDNTDNADYFLYKFNISKKDQKRIKNINNFYKEKINSKTFTEINMNKIFYYYGKVSTLDILCHRMIKSKKEDDSIKELIKHFEIAEVPVMPISADLLMKKFKIPEGKQLGKKLQMIEEEWVKNNFKISDHQVENIVNY